MVSAVGDPFGPPPRPPASEPAGESEQPPQNWQRRAGVNLPWSDRNSYGDLKRSRRNRALEEHIARGLGGRDPYGFRRDAPGRAVSAARNNPWLNIVFGLVGVTVVCSVFFGIGDRSVLSWIMLGVGGLCVVIIIQNLIRVPRWHRARRIAKRYIAEHGGELPEELEILS